MQLKLATREEIDFYKNKVYPLQDSILNLFFENFGGDFYLSGGTALSRFYFSHRLSEDLDLFSNNKNVKTPTFLLAEELVKLGYKVDIKNADSFFGRLFVTSKEGIPLKIDLIWEPSVDKLEKRGNIYLDTIENIAVKKIMAFEERAELKDLIDLYFIEKESKIGFEKILDLADKRRIPVPYEELLAVNTIGLQGKVSLLKEVSEEELKSFLKEIKSILAKNIKKKVQETKAEIDTLIKHLLWDFPINERRIDEVSLPILKRRMKTLPLPDRIALEEEIANYSYLNHIP